MPFASDRQRRAFFAMRGNSRTERPMIIKDNSISEAERRGVVIERSPITKTFSAFKNIKGKTTRISPKFKKKSNVKKFLKSEKDFDKDGVSNKKDCNPIDPKKQGRLHDLAISALRKKEEFVERRREKQMKKLEDLKDKLQARKALLSERNAVMAEKQAVIDEAAKERKAIKDLKIANREAKIELIKTSRLGRAVRGTAEGTRATIKGVKVTAKTIKKAADTSAKVLKKTGKVLNKLFGD